jgi:acyl carrier protein
MTDSIHPRICGLIADVFGVPLASVNAHSSQDTIEGWDSLTHIHLLVALEAEFGVTLDPEEAVGITSVAAIHAALVERGVAAAAS